jgi:hypothetical protein
VYVDLEYWGNDCLLLQPMLYYEDSKWDIKRHGRKRIFFDVFINHGT